MSASPSPGAPLGLDPPTGAAADAARSVADEFGYLAQLIRDGRPAQDTYELLAAAAVRLIDRCDHAAVSLLRGGKFVTAAATDEVARTMDALQRDTGQGPCLDALTEPGWVHEVDLSAVGDPSEFARRLRAETPVRALLGFRLVGEGRKAGALNLASDTPGAFTGDDAEQAAVLASFASVLAMAAESRQLADELAHGLDTSREIGTAVGIVMASRQVSAEEAFDSLRRASQRMNRKLRDVAQDLVRGYERGSQHEAPPQAADGDAG